MLAGTGVDIGYGATLQCYPDKGNMAIIVLAVATRIQHRAGGEQRRATITLIYGRMGAGGDECGKKVFHKVRKAMLVFVSDFDNIAPKLRAVVHPTSHKRERLT
ncbi:unnamed protein product, partial [Ceratitis capitata]